MSVRKLAQGFLETVPAHNLPELPPQNPDDMMDFAEPDPRDVKHESEPVRTINDALDFLSTIVEEVHEWIERETGDGHRTPEPRTKPLVMRTYETGASGFTAKRVTVPAGGSSVPLVFKREDRTILRLVNFGPDPVYIANTPNALVSAANALPTNVMTIPASDITVVGDYYPVELRTSDEVWAMSGDVNACVVEATELYGCE